MALPALRDDREEVVAKLGPAPPPGAPATSGRKEGSEAVPYLRRDVIVSHRRPRPLLAFLRLVAHGLLVAGLPVAGLTWALTSPRMGLQDLEVQGSARVPEAWVREAIEPWMGKNLFQLSLSAVERRLKQHPWLGGASVRKRLPDRLEISVAEKIPVALAEGSRQTFFVDSTGALIDALPEEASAADYPALPVVRGAEKVPEDVARALEIHREFQELKAGRLLEIEILGYDDYLLRPESLPYPPLVSSGSLREKFPYLGRLLAAVEARDQRIEAVDLRFAQRIVLQPEGASGTPGKRLPIRG